MLSEQVDAGTVAFEVRYESASQFNRGVQPAVRRTPGEGRSQLLASTDHTAESLSAM